MTLVQESSMAERQQVAADLAWWWRMTQSGDLNDPRNEASWWEQAAQVAINSIDREDGPMSEQGQRERRSTRWWHHLLGWHPVAWVMIAAFVIVVFEIGKPA